MSKILIAWYHAARSRTARFSELRLLEDSEIRELGLPHGGDEAENVTWVVWNDLVGALKGLKERRGVGDYTPAQHGRMAVRERIMFELAQAFEQGIDWALQQDIIPGRFTPILLVDHPERRQLMTLSLVPYRGHTRFDTADDPFFKAFLATNPDLHAEILFLTKAVRFPDAHVDNLILPRSMDDATLIDAGAILPDRKGNDADFPPGDNVLTIIEPQTGAWARAVTKSENLNDAAISHVFNGWPQRVMPDKECALLAGAVIRWRDIARVLPARAFVNYEATLKPGEPEGGALIYKPKPDALTKF